MEQSRFMEVEPGYLRLPPGRMEGPDLFKLVKQLRQYGSSRQGIPPLLVMKGRDGELMLLDGVTRASRMHLVNPGALVPVEVVSEQGDMDFGNLPRVRDRLG